MARRARIMLWGVLISAIAPGPVMAQADVGIQLARDRQCLACHQVEAKRVGPAFAAIAQRYADTPGAQSYLAGVIRQGSRARWGAIPMPAQQQASPSDATELAAWILSLVDNKP